jgi:hypothetical protein
MTSISIRRRMGSPVQAIAEAGPSQPSASARSEHGFPAALLAALIGAVAFCASMTVTIDTAEARKASVGKASGGLVGKGSGGFYGGRGAGRAQAHVGGRHVGGGRQAVRYPVRNVRSFGPWYRGQQRATSKQLGRAIQLRTAQKRLNRIGDRYYAAKHPSAALERKYDGAYTRYKRLQKVASRHTHPTIRGPWHSESPKKILDRAATRYIRFHPNQHRAELRPNPQPSSYRVGPRPLRAK